MIYYYALHVVCVGIVAQIFVNHALSVNLLASPLANLMVSLLGAALNLGISTPVFFLVYLAIALLPRARSGRLWMLAPAPFTVSVSAVTVANLALWIAPDINGTWREWPSTLIDAVLIVAALTIALAVCHPLHRLLSASPRKFGRRILLGALALWVGVVTLGSRQVYDSRLPDTDWHDLSQSRPARSPSRTLLIGIDGLDWEMVGTLALQDRLPALSRLTSEGASARVLVDVAHSPIVWTTVATGRSGAAHGILDFIGIGAPFARKPLRFRDDVLWIGTEWLRKRGVLSTVRFTLRMRRWPAVWNIASEAGLKVAVVNWLLSDQAEKVNGYFISTRAVEILASDRSREMDLVELDDLVAPAALAGTLSTAKMPQDKGLSEYLDPAIAEDALAGSLAQTLVETDTDLDLVALYVRAIDNYGHHWQNTIEQGATESEIEGKWQDLAAVYELTDRIVGRITAAAGEDWNIVVVSDHGWRFDRTFPGHSIYGPDGMLVLHGPSVGDARGLGTTRHEDIAPTLLSLLGLPVSRNLEGRDLLGDVGPQTEYVGGYLLERDWAEYVTRISPSPHSGPADEEYLERLRALGYID